MRQEEIEVAVPIVVGCGCRECRALELETRFGGEIIETTVSTIREDPDRLAIHAADYAIPSPILVLPADLLLPTRPSSAKLEIFLFGGGAR